MDSLIAFAKDKGIDPAMALAEGIDTILTRQAMAPTVGLRNRLMNEHLTEDASRARRLANTILRAQKQLGTPVDEDRMVKAMRLLMGKDGDGD